MPARSSIYDLPPDVRAELEQELVRRGFGGYDDLVAMLEERGYTISRSALGRFGKTFKERLGELQEITEQAKAAVDVLGDDEDALAAGALALAKREIFSALVDFRIDPEATDLSELTLALSRLTNSSVRLNEYRTRVRQRAETAAAEVASVAKAGGLSDEVANQIRAKILGVTG